MRDLQGGKQMDVARFIREDSPRTLFPLKATQDFVDHGEAELRRYVYESVFDPADGSSFTMSAVAYAHKDRHHLRPVLVLDPVAHFYIHDFVLRNARSFQRQAAGMRCRYGYGFHKRTPLDPSKQYHDFRKRKYELKSRYKFFAKADIANCFACFYHHDIVNAPST